MQLRPILGPVLVVITMLCGACASGDGDEFIMRLPEVERVWIGPDYYGNRLQDWRLANARVEVVTGASTHSMRTLQLLTYALSEDPGTLELSVRTGPIELGGSPHENTWTGFLIGAGGDHVDYRISAMVHDWPAPDGGLIVAVDGTGKIVVRDNSTIDSPKSVRANISTDVDAWPLIDPETIEFTDGVLEDFVLQQERVLGSLESFLGFELGRIVVRTDSIGRWRTDEGGHMFDFFADAMEENGYE